MTQETERLLHEASKLSPEDRAELIEKLLDNFSLKQRKEIDKAWADEAESRIEAYLNGDIESIPASKVFEEIERMET